MRGETELIEIIDGRKKLRTRRDRDHSRTGGLTIFRRESDTTQRVACPKQSGAVICQEGDSIDEYSGGQKEKKLEDRRTLSDYNIQKESS